MKCWCSKTNYVCIDCEASRKWKKIPYDVKIKLLCLTELVGKEKMNEKETKEFKKITLDLWDSPFGIEDVPQGATL